MKAKIFCEVTCMCCGTMALGSKFYQNSSTISDLKDVTKNWVWDETQGGNLCPICQEELKCNSNEE